MDQGTLVAGKIVDGRRYVEQFTADGNPIQAAAWMQSSDNGFWSLYIVRELLDQSGPVEAYRAVHASLHKIENSSLRSTQIQLMSLRNPAATDLFKLAVPSEAILNQQFGARTLGALEVDGGYLYSPERFDPALADAMSPDDVSRGVLNILLRSSGVLEPTRVNLKAGTHFNGLPFSLNLGSHKSLMIQFVVHREASPRMYQVNEIALI